jgi:hypothetical protein
MSTVQGGQGNIVTNGLVLNLDAANPRSYLPPYNGTTWFDLSGNSNNGTLINGPTFNSSNGGSIVFDGVDDRVTDTDTNFPSGGNSRTFSVWFKTPSSLPGASDIPMFLTYGTYDFNQSMFFGWEGRNLPQTFPYRLVVSNYGNQVYSNTALSANTIYNATVTKTSGSEFYTFYLNGVADGTNTWTGGSYTITNTVLNGSSNIGGNTFSGQYLKGNLYNMLIYNRALSASEINQNFQATRARFGI